MPEPIEIAMLVVSCDRYSDVWSTYFQMLHKFWPDNPLPVYLLNNTLKVNYPGVRQILVGDDVSWSDNLLCALEQIEQSYVLMALDDLMLTQTVDSAKFERISQWIATHQPNYLRLFDTPAPRGEGDDLIAELLPGDVYRTSTIWSIWKKEALQQLLKPGENAWQFEIDGSARADAVPGFFAVRSSAVQIANTIIRGHWHPAAVRLLKIHNAFPEPNLRPIMSAWEERKYALAGLRSRLFYCVPAPLRRRIRSAFKRS
jgi:hypothetical protein